MILPCVLLLTLNSATDSEPSIKRYGEHSTACAVLVENAALVHTTQLLASEGHRSSIQSEIENTFEQLDELLESFKSTPTDVVKLNFYVADEMTHVAASKHLRAWSPAGARTAVASVTTSLPTGGRFAIDAVFVARGGATPRAVEAPPTNVEQNDAWRSRHRARLLPQGDVVYVSGQAAAGELAAATTATLEGLLQTLKFMKLARRDIVQVKCFLQPMKDAPIVQRELAKFFKGVDIPPVSFVEWIAGQTRPIEIELVAAAPHTKTTRTVSYFTPTGMKSSPVFSRVARIHGNRRVYAAGLYSAVEGDGETQVHSIYQRLIRLLKPTKANLRHLAKATYYVADADVSAQLNKHRPHYYDPQRPPAASKAMVRGVGVKARSLSIDMIAAPEAPLIRVIAPLAQQLEPTRRVVYKTHGDRELHLHIFEPPGYQATDRRPVFLAIHGGGWTAGNVRDFYPFADTFAQQGMIGVSLEYRLKSEPAQTSVFDCVRDARSAIRWIRSHAAELGADPNRIVAMGGSAGGHLALSAAMFKAINDPNEDGDVSARPDALILMYPVIDTSDQGYGQQKIGDRWRELSPLHQVAAGLPPMLIFHGTGDDVTPYVGAQRFQTLAQDAGNDCQLITQPAGRHGYIIFDPQEYQQALLEMRRFLERRNLIAKKNDEQK